MKYDSLILYFTEGELEMSDNYQKFVSNPIIRDYEDKAGVALNDFANTPCPHSELIRSNDPKEQRDKILQSLKNHQDPAWVKEYFDNL